MNLSSTIKKEKADQNELVDNSDSIHILRNLNSNKLEMYNRNVEIK